MSGSIYFKWFAVVIGDQPQLAQCLEDEATGGWHGPAVGVEPSHVGVGGELGADLTFDQAEDEQRRADNGDQSSDPAVVLQEDRSDREWAFDGAVAAFDVRGLSFVRCRTSLASMSAGRSARHRDGDREDRLGDHCGR